MDLEQLRYLIEVSKSSSITSASKKLFMTPQAISISIKKLEKELGFQLLDRSYKGIVLTDEGRWLVRISEKFLSEIEREKQQYAQKELNKSPKKEHYEGELEIATAILGDGNSLLSQLICELYDKQPNLKISLVETMRKTVIDHILNKSLDLGFLYRTQVNSNYVDLLDEDLEFEPLFRGRFMILANENFDFTKYQSTSLKTIEKYPVVTHHPRWMHNSLQYFITEVCNLSLEETVESSRELFNQKLKHGIAISLTVHFDVYDQPLNYVEGVKAVPVRDDMQVVFGMVRRHDQELPETAAYFMDELRGLIDSARDKH